MSVLWMQAGIFAACETEYHEGWVLEVETYKVCIHLADRV